MKRAVQDAYGHGAEERVEALCCPVEYDPALLEAIPAEVVEKDYGCGDPSRYLRRGERVLDLGSGTGKICFIAAQIVGPQGSVVGVDMTTEMLDVARRAAPEVASRVGYANVEFRRGQIQDLALDLDALDEELGRSPVRDVEGLMEMEARAAALRRDAPMVPDGSVDVVVSNCVLNLVDGHEKPRLFRELYRVLRRGGRVVVSDIVSDEVVPDHLQRDPDMWSGCVSGALTEEAFLEAFENAGFYGIQVRVRQPEPWRVVEGIEFRSVTVEAFKGKEGPCFERDQAVIYKGPFKEVLDDDGHRFVRGRRVAVCDKSFGILTAEPYDEHFDPVEPVVAVPLREAEPFDCARTAPRHPRESKGMAYDVTTAASGPECGPEGCC